MKSFLKEMESKFYEFEKSDGSIIDSTNNLSSDLSDKGEDSEIDEQSVTSAVAGYNIPGAFTTEKNFKKKKFKYESVHDKMDEKYLKLIEGYRDFKSGDVKPSNKVKSTIQEIAKKLQEIETLVNYNSKLKTESGVTSSAYGPATQKALTKISERLIKISERVRSLGE